MSQKFYAHQNVFHQEPVIWYIYIFTREPWLRAGLTIWFLLLLQKTFIPIYTWKCSQTQIYTWNGSQIQIYARKHIKYKQTADCKLAAESKQTADAKFWQCYQNRIYVKLTQVIEMGKVELG